MLTGSREQVNGKKSDLDEFDMVSELAKVTGKQCPAPLANLRDKQIRFTGCCEKADMEKAVFDLLGI